MAAVIDRGVAPRGGKHEARLAHIRREQCSSVRVGLATTYL
jgi:hypothetical protein